MKARMKKAQSLAAGKACKALFWPVPWSAEIAFGIQHRNLSREGPWFGPLQYSRAGWVKEKTPGGMAVKTSETLDKRNAHTHMHARTHRHAPTQSHTHAPSPPHTHTHALAQSPTHTHTHVKEKTQGGMVVKTNKRLEKRNATTTNTNQPVFFWLNIILLFKNHSRMHAYAHTHYIHAHACMHACTHTHTHTHTRTQGLWVAHAKFNLKTAAENEHLLVQLTFIYTFEYRDFFLMFTNGFILWMHCKEEEEGEEKKKKKKRRRR